MAIAEYNALEPIVEELDNGLTVILEPLPYVYSVSTGVWIRTGSANEAPEIAGVSHFLEHLLFKGTDSRNARELMEAIERRGGQMNAFTSREYTCVFAKTLDQHVPTAIEILADIIKNPTFDDLDKERNVILEEIATSIDTPDEYAHDMLGETIWPDHPLGRPIAGYAETVAATGIDHIRAYKNAWYAPANMAVVVAGNFDPDAVLAQIRDEFASIAGPEVPQPIAPPVFSVQRNVVERDIAQNHIALGFQGTPVTAQGRYRFDVLSSILGGGSTSRLFDSIREENGLAYAIYAFNSPFRTAGMVGVYACVAHENLQRTVDLIFDETKRLADETVGADELEGNREQLKGGLLMALENTFNRMARMARSWMFFGRIVPVEEILAGVEAVTAEDVQTLAQEILPADRAALAVLGPQPSGGVVLPE